jgi:hypothetical protein
MAMNNDQEISAINFKRSEGLRTDGLGLDKGASHCDSRDLPGALMGNFPGTRTKTLTGYLGGGIGADRFIIKSASG